MQMKKKPPELTLLVVQVAITNETADENVVSNKVMTKQILSLVHKSLLILN